MLDWSKLTANREYLGKVFLTLIFQLVVTFCVVLVLSKNPLLMRKIFNWVALLILFLLSLCLVVAIGSSKVSLSIKFLLFTLFSILFGLMLSPIGLVNRNVLLAAAGGAVLIFVVMFLGGAILTSMKIDLSILGAILFACLVGLLVAALVSALFGVYRQHIGWVYFGLVVYALFVVFDTQIILQKRVDYVQGALQYYLDVIGIFIRLVEIFGRGNH